MRDYLALQCMRLAARLTRWGHPYGLTMDAMDAQRRHMRPGLRCAECTCEDGGDDCEWIRTE